MLKKLFGNKEKTPEELVSYKGTDSSHLSNGASSVLEEKIKILASSCLTGAPLHLIDIPEKKLSNVMQTYGMNAGDILAVYDTTVLKSGKDGMVIGKEMIGVKHSFESPQTINMKGIVQAGIHPQTKSIYTDGNMVLNVKRDEYVQFFKELKELLISEDEGQRELYEQTVDSIQEEIEGKIKSKDFTSASEVLARLERTMVNSHSADDTALAYYYGSGIKSELHEFEEAYRYHLLLENLHIWEPADVDRVKVDIDCKKAEYEFGLLEEEKEGLIHNHHFNEAISIVMKQKDLNVRKDEELEEEKRHILTLEKEYILSLESSVVDKLEQKDFSTVLEIIEELNSRKPGSQYEEWYIRAQMGLLAFEEAERRVHSLAETNSQLAETLLTDLQTARGNVSETIYDAVLNKNYSFFTDHQELSRTKDRWGMTPLMYFIVEKDMKGVQLLAHTYKPNERNILGHTAMNLACMDLGDGFTNEAVLCLDQNLITMLKQLKNKETKNKVGSLLIKGVDSINKNVGSFAVMEATSEIQGKMEYSLESYMEEVKDYADQLKKDNNERYVRLLLHPHDFEKEYHEIITIQDDIERELAQHLEKKYLLEKSFGEQFNYMKNLQIKKILYEAASLDLGEKDEFETTSEFEERILKKAEELETVQEEHEYVRAQLQKLKEETKASIEKERSVNQGAIHATESKLKAVQKKISELTPFLGQKVNKNELLGRFYRAYAETIEVGKYDADSETFTMNVNQNERRVIVPRTIAKTFKTQFDRLKPEYELSVEKGEGQTIIRHIFVYEVEGEKVRIAI